MKRNMEIYSIQSYLLPQFHSTLLIGEWRALLSFFLLLVNVQIKHIFVQSLFHMKFISFEINSHIHNFNAHFHKSRNFSSCRVFLTETFHIHNQSFFLSKVEGVFKKYLGNLCATKVLLIEMSNLWMWICQINTNLSSLPLSS